MPCPLDRRHALANRNRSSARKRAIVPPPPAGALPLSLLSRATSSITCHPDRSLACCLSAAQRRREAQWRAPSSPLSPRLPPPAPIIPRRLQQTLRRPDASLPQLPHHRLMHARNQQLRRRPVR